MSTIAPLSRATTFKWGNGRCSPLLLTSLPTSNVDLLGSGHDYQHGLKMDHADCGICSGREPKKLTVTSPSRAFLTDVQLLQMPAKTISGRSALAAN
jgi:hypothetical protein